MVRSTSSRFRVACESAPPRIQVSKLQWAVYALVAVSCCFGLYRAIANWWVCDDAFISFRYARHLVQGHGLIYNLGERVEGYSNFLWTVVVAGGMKLGIDPVPLTLVLGILSYLSVVAIFAVLSRRLFYGGGLLSAVCIPITSLMLLTHREMHVFATSGLETMWTTALVSLGFAMLLFAGSFRSYVVAGTVFIAAALSRPDGLLFYLMAAPFVFLVARGRWRALAGYLLPLMLIYVPYWIWRYSYYGYPFPNTYYAKSGGDPYYSQGLVYLWTYVHSYYVLLLVPVCVAAVLWVKRRQLARFSKADLSLKAVVLALLLVGPYMAYIVRVGGDFMFARFWIVATPFLFFLIEAALRTFLKRESLLVATVCLFGLLVLLRVDLYADSPKRQISGIAYERAYYPPERHAEAKAHGLRLREYFAGLDVRMAFRGMFAMHIYYSDVPLAIEAAAGLTDEFIAHQALPRRGRPGHEKLAPAGYLHSRGVQFVLRGMLPPVTPGDSLTRIDFGGLLVQIMAYDAGLMNELKRFPDVTFTDLPQNLDELLPELPSFPIGTRRDIYAFFKQLYFDHTSDPVRQQAFERLLR